MKPWRKTSGSPMNNLHISEEAQNDLLEIKRYISEELENPAAAHATISKITKKIRILEKYASAGAPLSSIAATKSDYRFLVSGNYLIFYRACGKDIYIDRILYSRRDYLRILFGNVQTDHPNR